MLIHVSYKFLIEAKAEMKAVNRRQVAQIDRLNDLVARLSDKCGLEDGTFWVLTRFNKYAFQYDAYRPLVDSIT